MRQRLPFLVLLCIVTLLCAVATDAPATQTPATPDENPKRLVLVLPDGFRGWACVEFGVSEAPPLPREGDALIVRPRPREVLKTSDRPGGSPIFSETWFEINGERHALPQDVLGQREVRRSDSRSPVQAYCVFYGTVDEADAAGKPPGFESPTDPSQRVSAGERQALVALYEATGGSHWKHRVGWLGPPGTECSWHGVTCGTRDGEPGVSSLELSENNLAGRIPDAIGRLPHLERLGIARNHLSGRLPDALIQRWLAGSLRLIADDPLLTDVSEIDYETVATALLCERRRIVLRVDRTATLLTTRCRNATPEDRTTFCEVREGHIWWGEFPRLAWLIERNGFFGLRANYSESVTDVGLQTTRVTRGGKAYTVSNYATPGPFELWIIQNAIEGVASSVEWEKTSTKPKCPRLAEF